MIPDPKHPWHAWQDAEGRDDPEAADRAFARLAGPWARSVAPAGLAVRVAALGPGLVGGRRPAVVPTWARLSIGSALALVGVTLGILPAGTLGGLMLASVQVVAGGIGSVLGMLDGWGRAIVALAIPAVRVARAIAAVVVEPVPLLVVLLNVLLATAALAALRRLLSVREV